MPEKVLQSLPEQENPEQALQVFTDLISQFRQAGAPGVHVFVLSDTDLSCRGVRALLQ
jgi:pyoverdine/dityrosine biosynthesis protein Dit1